MTVSPGTAGLPVLKLAIPDEFSSEIAKGLQYMYLIRMEGISEVWDKKAGGRENFSVLVPCKSFRIVCLSLITHSIK
jgi:hypothetical protein